MRMPIPSRAVLVLAGFALAGLHATAAPPPTSAEVGDADSFGKRVIWIGLASTGGVLLTSDCTPDPQNPLGPDDRCVVLNAGTTNFNFPDLGRITLPGNSVNSLICHWSTPTIFYRFSNPSATASTGQFVARATYRIESEVLANPVLINPLTGLPFGGGIDVSIAGVSESRSLAPGEFATHQATATRTCIAGLISKASLTRDYGLSDAQVKTFFKNPITIRVGTRGSARGVSDASVLFSTRFTADDK